MDCPRHYQDALTLAGGRNPYGEPRFILQWGETPVRRRLCPDELIAHRKMRCWALCEWRPASDYPLQSWPEGLPYPASGRYEPVQVFRDGQEMVPLDSDALNVNVLRMMVRHIMESYTMRMAEKYRAFAQMEQDRKDAQREKIADCLSASLPAFQGAASYARNHGTRTAVEKKIEQLENNLRRGLPRLPRGYGIANATT